MVSSPKKLKWFAIASYCLYLLTTLVPALAIVAIIITLFMKRSAAGTPYASHFSNQIIIFCVFLVAVIGAALFKDVTGWRIIASIVIAYLAFSVIVGLSLAIMGKEYLIRFTPKGEERQ